MAPTSLPPLDKVDPATAWQPWEPTNTDPWNLKWAGHLYRRAAFGGSPDELKTAVKKGHTAAIDLLLNGEPRAKNFLTLIEEVGRAVARTKQPNPQFEMFQPRGPIELREWWLRCMLMYGHPLREKMTLFWHNHFATSIAKVHSWKLMVEQNLLMRRYALGKFGPFLLDMSKDVAMLQWLDSNSNVKGHANENYGREIQELFTLGVGNYTEKDIQEAARAFTGWHEDGEKFEFDATLHDDDEKVFHGVKGQLNGDDVVAILLKQPTCARFLATKFYNFFVSEAQLPPPQLIEPLAEQLRKTDYDIGALVKTILSSKHFYSDYAFRRRVKCPVEFVLGAALATADNPAVANFPLVKPIDDMGQPLFSPPNVKGWRGGQAWLSTATVLARQNFGQRLAMGTLWDGNRPEYNPNIPEAIEPEIADEFPQPGDPNVKPGVQPKKPAKPEEAPPPPGKDPARHIADIRSASADKIVDRLIDVYLPGGISKVAHAKLTAFIAEGKPTDKALDRRVREVVHAIISMPEYQLS